MRRNMKVFRAERGLTQQQFADKLGYTRETVNRIELGKATPRFTFMEDLKETFGLDWDHVLTIMKDTNENEGE